MGPGSGVELLQNFYSMGAHFPRGPNVTLAPRGPGPWE